MFDPEEFLDLAHELCSIGWRASGSRLARVSHSDSSRMVSSAHEYTRSG